MVSKVDIADLVLYCNGIALMCAHRKKWPHANHTPLMNADVNSSVVCWQHMQCASFLWFWIWLMARNITCCVWRAISCLCMKDARLTRYGGKGIFGLNFLHILSTTMSSLSILWVMTCLSCWHMSASWHVGQLLDVVQILILLFDRTYRFWHVHAPWKVVHCESTKRHSLACHGDSFCFIYLKPFCKSTESNALRQRLQAHMCLLRGGCRHTLKWQNSSKRMATCSQAKSQLQSLKRVWRRTFKDLSRSSKDVYKVPHLPIGFDH